MENMENHFSYAPYQWEAVSHILVFGVGATLAGLVYFLVTAHLVAPKYRMSSFLSGVVMISAAIILYNQHQSWQQAFQFNGQSWVSSYSGDSMGYTFSNGYRYLNWAIDVPMLLLQILFVVPLMRGKSFMKIASTFVVAGLAMIGFSYVAQFFEYGFNPSAPDSSAQMAFWLFYGLGWAAYLVILVAIYRGVFSGASSRLSPRAASVTRGIWLLFLVSWTVYGIAIAMPAISWSPSGGVWRQYLFTMADVVSKVIYGAMLGQVAMIRSAEDGFEPAMESMGVKAAESKIAAPAA